VGHFAKVVMEDNMRDMMQRLDEVARLLREPRHSRLQRRSPPRRNTIPVDGEDRWMEGSRGLKSHRSSLTFAVNSTFIGLVTATIGAPFITGMAIFRGVAVLHCIVTTHHLVGEIVTGRWSSLYL